MIEWMKMVMENFLLALAYYHAKLYRTLEFLLSWIETMTNFMLTHWQQSMLSSEICYLLST